MGGRAMLLTCLIAGLLVSAAGPEPGDSPAVKKLLKERVAALKDCVEGEEALLKAGRGSPERVVGAAVELAEAELEIADTAEKRREIRLRIFKLAVGLEELAKARRAAAVGDLQDVLKARAFRLKAEIELRRAGGAPPKVVKPPREPKGPKDD